MRRYAPLVSLGVLLFAVAMVAALEPTFAVVQCPDTGRLGEELCVDHERIDFGALSGGRVDIRTVTVTNLTAADQPFGGLVLRGPEAFDVVGTTCSLASGVRGAPAATSCEISIGFVPSEVAPNEAVASTLLITAPTNPSTTCLHASDCLAKIKVLGRRAP